MARNDVIKELTCRSVFKVIFPVAVRNNEISHLDSGTEFCLHNVNFIEEQDQICVLEVSV